MFYVEYWKNTEILYQVYDQNSGDFYMLVLGKALFFFYIVELGCYLNRKGRLRIVDCIIGIISLRT